MSKTIKQIPFTQGAYFDSLYQNFQSNPDSVDESLQHFFSGFEFAKDQEGTAITSPVASNTEIKKEIQVARLIHAYRDRGHFKAKTNPVRPRKDRSPGLALENFGLTESDLSTPFFSGDLIGLKGKTLKEIIDRLEILYCGPIGIEYCHIKNGAIRDWVKRNWEESIDTTSQDTFGLTLDKRKRILEKLNLAVVFENFLHTKYVGQKRFSLEGGENTIPALDAAINEAALHGVNEVVIGMAHRGRLNILANIMNKSVEEIFSEFEGKKIIEGGDGDVKYHLGFRTTHLTPTSQKVNLELMPNPSHLETVAPVVLGYARAKADVHYLGKVEGILPIIIHGDAALAGQGVAYEVAQMAKLPAFYVGGTLHFVINNQVGFTTDYWEGRSSHYCTQVGQINDSLILHVNGDDADAVSFAAEFAIKFRQEFHADVYIDMLCYRRHGHNEGDEPRFTQPTLYALIDKHPDPRKIYSQELIERGEILADLALEMQEQFKNSLQNKLDLFKNQEVQLERTGPASGWGEMRSSRPEDFESSPTTAVSKERIISLHKILSEYPADFNINKKVLKLLNERKERLEKDQFDWAMAELFAYGSLIQEGAGVRLCGQDVLRGTFTHRHAVMVDEKTNQRYCPLSEVAAIQDEKIKRFSVDGRFQVHNSLLSEYAVLGFEYGYSFCHPDNLVLWEAQFGDFSNGGQIIIDQFLSSAESKWQRSCGLVLLLPHGYEGQGPEHSSARPERYLQLSAEFNMVVANASTPANFFHLLRRQLYYPFRKPLVVMSPKKLLRYSDCISPMSEFTQGAFQEFFDDDKLSISPDKIKRVILCTGKVYFDLLEFRKKHQINDIALVRMEQLHPIPFAKFDSTMKKYVNAEFVWVQEEPKNMGYWNYILRKLDYYNLKFIGRKSSASTASGYMSVHQKEQDLIMEQALLIKVKGK